MSESEISQMPETMIGREVVTAEGCVPWLIVAEHVAEDGRPTFDLVTEFRGQVRRRYRVRFDLLRHPISRKRLNAVEEVD